MCLVNNKGWKKEGNRKKGKWEGRKEGGKEGIAQDLTLHHQMPHRSWLTFPPSTLGILISQSSQFLTPLPIYAAMLVSLFIVPIWMWCYSPGQLLLIIAQVLMPLPGHQRCTLVPSPGSQTPASWKGNQKIMLQTKPLKQARPMKCCWFIPTSSHTWSQQERKLFNFPNFHLIHLWKEVKKFAVNRITDMLYLYLVFYLWLLIAEHKPSSREPPSPSSGAHLGQVVLLGLDGFQMAQ